MDFSALNPRSTNSLNIAARNNNVDEVKRLLTNGGNWANCDNRGWCAIHEAAANDCWQTLSVLLKYQTDRHLIETFEGQTALYLACRNRCSMTTIQLLLDNIPEIALYASNEMVSPLHIVAEQGRVDALEALIKAGALLNLQDFDGDTPLHDAVRAGQAQITKILLHAGAEPELKNAFGLTPFLLSCFKGYLDCAQELFPFVTNINDSASDGNTGLILAASRGALNITRFLLDNGANPNIPNEEGALPLYTSLTHGHAKLFQLLLPVTDFNNINRNLMHFACKPLYFSMDIIITLLESNLGPEFFNTCDEFHVILENIFGYRPRYSKCPPLCSLLNVTDYIHKTSPVLCETLLLLMLSKGVAVNALYDDECPPLVYLHYCEHFNSYQQIIGILVDHGCNVDYSTVPPDNKLKLADALIASITSNCHTLPTLLTYSLKTEPEYVINKLVQYNMVDSRISVEILLKILPMCCLSLKTIEKISQQLSSYIQPESEYSVELRELLKFKVPPLKHICRRVIRHKLKQRLQTTSQFLFVLNNLPLPPTLKLYIRYL